MVNVLTYRKVNKFDRGALHYQYSLSMDFGKVYGLLERNGCRRKSCRGLPGSWE